MAIQGFNLNMDEVGALWWLDFKLWCKFKMSRGVYLRRTITIT